MNYKQILRVIDILEERGYSRPIIEMWLHRDPDIIEEYLGIDLSNI